MITYIYILKRMIEHETVLFLNKHKKKIRIQTLGGDFKLYGT